MEDFDVKIMIKMTKMQLVSWNKVQNLGLTYKIDWNQLSLIPIIYFDTSQKFTLFMSQFFWTRKSHTQSSC